MKLIQSSPLVIGIKGAPIKVKNDGVAFKTVTEKQLNVAKRQLDKYFTPDRVSRTTMISSSLDVYRGILTLARNAGAQSPTNAWSKYVELYTIIPHIINRAILDVRVGDVYNAFLNAELPGSSIAALNHVFKTIYPSATLDWVASSFKPDGVGTQLEDKYGFLAGSPDRWLISREDAGDFDGDMMTTSVVRDCVTRYLQVNPKGCDLYSHDAGIDVTVDTDLFKAYEDQERANFKLHLGCAIVGLETLREGGTFIAKQYTLYEENSKRLVEVYANFFDEFYLIKPATSRPYNSESYLVGVGYRRPHNADELLRRMYELHALDTLDVISRHKDIRNDDFIRIFTDDMVDGAYAQNGVTEYMRTSAGRQVVFLNEMGGYLSRDKKGPTQAYERVISDWWKASGLGHLKASDRLPTRGSTSGSTDQHDTHTRR
jgi:hypothetical protein